MSSDQRSSVRGLRGSELEIDERLFVGMTEEEQGDEHVVDGPADRTQAQESAGREVEGVGTMALQPLDEQQGDAPQQGLLTHRQGGDGREGREVGEATDVVAEGREVRGAEEYPAEGDEEEDPPRSFSSRNT